VQYGKVAAKRNAWKLTDFAIFILAGLNSTENFEFLAYNYTHKYINHIEYFLDRPERKTFTSH
jgi:hypothetical protein